MTVIGSITLQFNKELLPSTCNKVCTQFAISKKVNEHALTTERNQILNWPEEVVPAHGVA